MSFCTDVVKMGIAALAELAVVDTVASVPAPVSVPFAVSASPNPSSASAGISFALGSPGDITARIYDVQGREVKTLFEGSLPAGRHEITWQGDDRDGSRASAGVYFATVETRREAIRRRW